MNNIKMTFCIHLHEHVLVDLINMKSSADTVHQFELGSATKLRLRKLDMA